MNTTCTACGQPMTYVGHPTHPACGDPDGTYTATATPSSSRHSAALDIIINHARTNQYLNNRTIDTALTTAGIPITTAARAYNHAINQHIITVVGVHQHGYTYKSLIYEAPE